MSYAATASTHVIACLAMHVCWLAAERGCKFCLSPGMHVCWLAAEHGCNFLFVARVNPLVGCCLCCQNLQLAQGALGQLTLETWLKDTWP